MERKQEWEVGGYQFGSPKDAELARAELEKIAYMEKRMRYDQPESVLQVYNKAVETRVFQTPVGFQYLQKVKGFLAEQGLSERAKGIPLYQVYSYDPNEKLERRVAPRHVQPSQYKRLRGQLRRSVLLNIILAILVAAMFAIALNSDNPNILNYKKNLTDQYAGWEQELSEREAVIREKERALSAQE